jgi:hypothetical protein
MILALSVVLGFVISLLRHRGRAFDQIAAIALHWVPLALLALALQWSLLRAPAGPIQDFCVQRVLLVLSHSLLLAFVWRNRRQVGVLILGLGVLCNLVVIAANGGLMPITPETLVQINPGSALEQWTVGTHYGYSKDVILLREGTRFWILSDVLVIPRPFPWPTAFSLGDLLIALGVLVLLQGPGTLSESIPAGVHPS